MGEVKPSTATPTIVAISVDISLSMEYDPSTAHVVVGFASERMILLSDAKRRRLFRPSHCSL